MNQRWRCQFYKTNFLADLYVFTIVVRLIVRLESHFVFCVSDIRVCMQNSCALPL